MVTLALLHTSPVHVPVFDALRDAHHPGLALAHHVHEDLLARARARGPEAVADDVQAALESAVAAGAGAVLCTCSTLGGVAESRAAAVGVPVLRVDRPMAAAAVGAGAAVAVVAAVPSTLEPTLALLDEEAGRPLDPRTVVVDGAWERFEAGDRQGYLRLVARAVERVAPGADAVVLAQASMADAAGLAEVSVPVLASPRTGLAAAAGLCGEGDARTPTG
ncbi:arylsulfatase [Streptomyces sp. PmtG]